MLIGLSVFPIQSLALEPKLPIYESQGNFQTVPKFQPPRLCNIARHQMSDQLGHIRLWFNQVLYGSPPERLLLSNIAVQVQDMLLAWGRHAEMVGLEKYKKNRTQNTEYNGDKKCYDYIMGWQLELERVMTIIKNEAKLGNRSLDGTGIIQLIKHRTH